jgi:hypothetical protein
VYSVKDFKARADPTHLVDIAGNVSDSCNRPKRRSASMAGATHSRYERTEIRKTKVANAFKMWHTGV